MPSLAVFAALEIARARHLAIASGDFETYTEADDALGAACRTLADEGPALLSANDIPLLDELIALETQSRRLLDLMMSETSARMDTLRTSGRANGAYMRQERLSVNGA